MLAPLFVTHPALRHLELSLISSLQLNLDSSLDSAAMKVLKEAYLQSPARFFSLALEEPGQGSVPELPNQPFDRDTEM